MESRRTFLFSIFCLFSLLLSSPVAFGAPVKRQYSSLTRRIAAEIDASLGKREPFDTQKRDVVSPKITNPTASSVWPVGSTQTVTWDTSDLPPLTQITNKIGKVILGHDSGDSLNLDLDHPLAQGFQITDGKVSIVVPNVPPRSDYLIVLMGDSGNTSPSFAITSISGGTPSSSTTPTITRGGNAPSPGITGSATGTAISLSSTLITDPIPITGSVITGGDPNAPTAFPTVTDAIAPSPTTTAATSSTATTSIASTPSSAGSAQPDTNTNAASKHFTGRFCWTLVVGILVASVASL